MWGINLLHRADPSASNAGSVAILAALSLPVLIGMAGAAAETAVWFELKRRAQNAADGAAVAGAIQRARGETANVQTSAKRAATQNGFTNGVGDTTVTINYPPTSGAYAGQPDAVEAIVTRQFTPMLTALFLSSNLTIYARAVAEVKVVGKACVLALSTTASNAINVQGSTIANNSGCTVASNSGHASSAVNMAGNATLEAYSVWSGGGFSTPNDTSQLILNEPAKTKMWPLDDPYANIDIPGVLPTCQTPPTIPNDGTPTTIMAGRYCGGSMTFGAQSVTTMASGTYYLDSQGSTVKFDVRGDAQLSGSNVTIVLMDSSSTSTASRPATIEINAGANVNLTAPTSGPFPGMLVYQQRDATVSATNKLNGGADMVLQGAIYIPDQDLWFNGDNSSMANGCVILVANTITFIGNSTVVNSGCDDMGISPVQVTGVRLKE